jgi:hypothetical protein
LNAWDPAGSLSPLYEQLAPLAYADADNDFVVMKLCEAVIGRGPQIEDLARDTDDDPGWSALTDPDRAPDYNADEVRSVLVSPRPMVLLKKA